MNRDTDKPSVAIVFAIGMLVGALLTCIGMAIAIPAALI